MAPIITILGIEQLEAYTITEGHNITCAATGYPLPNIVWLNYNGSAIDEDRIGDVMTTNDGHLFIVSVSMTIRRDEGGVYKCKTSNSLGNNATTINITVQCKHSIGLLYIASLPHDVLCCSNADYHYNSK